MEIRNLKHTNKRMILAFIISIMHFASSFVLDKSFFEYSKFNQTGVIVNILFFIILNITWYKILSIIKNRKKYKSKIIIFSIYFTFMMILLLLTFPGIWRIDDIQMAVDARSFKLNRMATYIF